MGDRRAGRPRAWLALTALLSFVATATLVSSPAEAAYQFVRWAGSSRWATSVAVSESRFPNGADTVIVADGTAFPDALAAGPVAGHLGAPVLLTQPTALPAAIAAELDRLEPSEVLIVGGPSAVSDAVEAKIATITGVAPTRLAGTNRYETAAKVAAYGFPTATTVYVASGVTFPDALAGGPAGGHRGRPVLLTGPDALPAATAGAIGALGQPDIVVLGGVGAVGNGVVDELDRLTTGTVRRVQGPNRFATSVAMSVDTYTTASTVFLASGLTFPDALSATSAASAAGAPILLTQPHCVPAQVLTEIYRLGATEIITIGGTGAVSPTAAGLVPCSPPVTPLFSFMAPGGNGWARWDSCIEEIYYHVHLPGATADELAAIPDAVAAVEAASGFDLVFVGYVSDDSWPDNSDASIAFVPTMLGNAIGEGGIWTVGDEVVQGFVKVVSGLSAPERRHTLIHELAHMLALDHADDPTQVMYPQLPDLPLSEYAAGDREGLRLVGATMPCISTASLSREGPQLVTWVDERAEGS